jgi:flagellar M-ring protein FliF
MDQIKRLLDSLSLKHKITIAAAALAAFAAIYSLVHWQTERDYKPLYTDLAPEDAGLVLAKVRESGVPYRIGDGGASVLVPSAKVSELRLQLAAAGIPKSGRIGFEIFDKTNFGASDFTEQVNLHRALEGELERTIMSISAIDQARVHITFAKDSIFTDERQPAKASVLVKLRPGARLEPQNVVAISNLVAGAVEGLSPDGVSVVDMRGNLLSHPKPSGSPDDPAPSGAAIEYKQAVERDLSNKIAATLTPLLGEGKFRAGVSADVDFSSGDQSEETFDPTKSVMTSSQKTEDITGGGTSLGVPGTASNLPSPPSRPASARTATARRTENISYETSRVVRRIHLPQGTIKRLSSSVLVDYAVRWQGSGDKAKRVLDPPSAGKLKSIHDLVAAAIGFNAARGDELVIEALPFESTLNPEQLDTAPAAKSSNLPPWLENLLAGKNYLFVGAAAGVAVLLAVIAALVFLRSRTNNAPPDRPYHPGQLPTPGGLVPAQTYATASGDDPAERVSKEMEAKLAEQQALREKQAQEVLNSLKLPQVSTKKTEVLAKHVAEEAKKDPAVTAHLIRTWLHEGEA